MKDVLSYNLQRLRLAAKLIQTDLSKLSGVPQADLSAYETEKQWPTYKRLTQLSEALNIDMQELFLPIDFSTIMYENWKLKQQLEKS